MCTGLTPLFYATDPTSKRPAVAVCMTCPVGEPCLADAQATEVGWRIYGERAGSRQSSGRAGGSSALLLLLATLPTPVTVARCACASASLTSRISRYGPRRRSAAPEGSPASRRRTQRCELPRPNLVHVLTARRVAEQVLAPSRRASSRAAACRPPGWPSPPSTPSDLHWPMPDTRNAGRVCPDAMPGQRHARSGFVRSNDRAGWTTPGEQGITNARFEQNDAQICPVPGATLRCGDLAHRHHLLRRSGRGIHEHRPDHPSRRAADLAGLARTRSQRVDPRARPARWPRDVTCPPRRSAPRAPSPKPTPRESEPFSALPASPISKWKGCESRCASAPMPKTPTTSCWD